MKKWDHLLPAEQTGRERLWGGLSSIPLRGCSWFIDSADDAGGLFNALGPMSDEVKLVLQGDNLVVWHRMYCRCKSPEAEKPERRLLAF